MKNNLIKKLKKHGWIFEHTDKNRKEKDNKEIEIIKKTSINLYKWCSFFDALYSSAEDEWFLSLNDFRNNSDSSFSWNEFEKICIESCSSPKEEIEVRIFWSGHLPIFMSTKSGYQYWAIKTSGENIGAIYYGREPEFEEVTKIAENFDDLIKKINLSLDTNNKILGIDF
ncbi:hypothetical protein HA050_20875 [Iodobacter sp. HSC-16F04]|uniref:SMI1/KNR4 family protein n=1 Tax=Iodobacter violaceini TaxID=3044271 RepID=A0ABX0KV54_9NEIS|nr:SMI1/KNR4 family protein [Iodobacter violacea]NHQ88556.1 hypothetical protein [Iodobacter violacea]